MTFPWREVIEAAAGIAIAIVGWLLGRKNGNTPR
jgi:hypothetical protein